MIMQKIIPLLFVVSLFYLTTDAQVPIPNVPYGDGTDPEQVIDVYLPSLDFGRINKVIILIHGGAWGAGSKAEMAGWVPIFQTLFPDYCVTNMEYRLGTTASPGFPKQLEDIHLAISFLKSTFTTNVTFALFGGSAGAHLSMLYSYLWDSQTKNVKVVVDLVGPADLTDPAYTEDPIVSELFLALVGPCRYAECPDLYNATSPVTYVSADSAPTIGFYGNADPLVPISQVGLLKNKLDAYGVINNFTVYPGGHFDWAWEYTEDMILQMADFFNTHWN